MRRGDILCLAAVALLVAPAVGAAATAPDVSWGKPGVAYEDYRRDAAECGTRGATTSMKGRPEYDAVILGLGRQDSDIDNDLYTPPNAFGEDQTVKLARDYALNGARSRPEPKVKRLQAFLAQQVTACLTEKGYVPFTLTPEQSATLKTYKKGSDARFRYLHHLASDAAVVGRGR